MLTEQQFLRARREFRDSRSLAQPLLAELAEIAGHLIRFGHLPPSYSPYGQWDQEAGEDVLQAWLERRLLEEGGLLDLFDRAATPQSFRRLAQGSLRQFVIGARERTHSQNLFRRCGELLEGDERFFLLSRSSRRQNALWGLSAEPERAPFARGERDLLGHAYSLGDFELTIYKASSKKLEPLLSTQELTRFLVGLLIAAGPLTLTQIMRALELRFDLESPSPESIGEDLPSPLDERVEEVVVGRTLALAVIAELTKRQCRVLLGRRAEVSIETLASELRCSTGTIVNEQAAISGAVKSHCDSKVEAEQLLKNVGDLLYEGNADE